MVDSRGLEEEGIFRLSGSKQTIFRLRAFVNLNWEYSLESEDIHAISGLLKLFLREMPEPLIPVSVYPAVLAVMNDYRDELQQASGLRRLLHDRLSPAHLELLQTVFGLMVRVAARAQANKMHPKNLAVVLAPNILRLHDESQTSFNDMHNAQAATELLIKAYSTILE